MSDEKPASAGWSNTLSNDISDRIGMYQSLSDVPLAYRLENIPNPGQYDDAWERWVSERVESEELSERTQTQLERVGRKWREHMESVDRHYVCADPSHVEAFFEKQLDRMKLQQAYHPYWVSLESFFWYLHDRTEYPHLYHPVLIAALEYPTAARLWEKKIGQKKSTQ
jgi:hypothetical protein